MSVSPIIVIVLVILLLCVAMLLCGKPSGAIGGLAGIIGGAAGLISGGGKPRKRKFEPVAGDRSGLKVQAELKLPSAKPLSDADVKKAVAVVKEKLSFEPMGAAEKKHLEENAKKLKMNPNTLIGMRHIMTSQHIANNVADVIAASDAIVADSKSGKTIVEIAAARNAPPLAIARQILLTRGSTMREVREMITGKSPLPEDLADQVAAAVKLDHGSRESMEKIMKHAEEFEKEIQAWLDKNKIKYKTEAQLKDEQTADPKFGRPVATPDFFFPDPIKLNGNVVNWLDAKDFPFFSMSVEGQPDRTPKVVKSMAYQASKYNKNFGRGVFVFSGGVADGVSVATKKGPVDVDLIAFA